MKRRLAAAAAVVSTLGILAGFSPAQAAGCVTVNASVTVNGETTAVNQQQCLPPAP
jgi:hypothetical protein